MNKYETFSSQQDSDIDLKPFINFLVVLIPVLMISAEFSKIAVVEASSARCGSTGLLPDTSGQISSGQNALGLTLLITDSTITLGSNSAFLPSIYYREYHTYVARDNRTNQVVTAYDARDPKKDVFNPQNRKPFGLDERQTIDLYVVNEKHEIVKCIYMKNGGMVTDEMGTALKAVKRGERVTVVGPDRTLITVDRPADFILKPLSAYDELRSMLMQIRAQAGVDRRSDSQSIRIAAESSVIYDKIIQLMDVARVADFPDISIAKLKG